MLCDHRCPSQDTGLAMTQQGLSSLQMLQQALNWDRPHVEDVLRHSEENYRLAGTASGGLFALQCPDLQNYSHARAHKQSTLDVVALGEGAVSASADWIRFHSTGSVPRLTVTAEEVYQSPHVLRPNIIHRFA